MASDLIYRAARPEDAFALAELLIMAGDGMFAFLLEEFAPENMLAGLMARSIRQDAGGTSWRHCFVAEAGGAIAGMINAYPASWLREEERDVLPPDRVDVLEPIDQAQDWESFLVSGVAVRGPWKRQGIASELVNWAVEQAGSEKFSRLTANVWQDNVAAVALLQKTGFRVQAQVEVPPHPALLHSNGSLLMGRETINKEDR